ncbi:MAG: tetratricopeptide repeat protein [Hyphomicrobiales bacterium]
MGKFEDASLLYDQERFSDAFELFLELANSGDASACSNIARMLADGCGTSRDVKKSMEWDLKAIALGETSSMINLAITLRWLGRTREARRWLEQAVRAGDDEALLELARLLDVSDYERQSVIALLQQAKNSPKITDVTRADVLAFVNEIQRRT